VPLSTTLSTKMAAMFLVDTFTTLSLRRFPSQNLSSVINGSNTFERIFFRHPVALYRTPEADWLPYLREVRPGRPPSGMAWRQFITRLMST